MNGAGVWDAGPDHVLRHCAETPRRERTTVHKRETAIERISAGEFDVLVIGGGINGAVATMALAAHGASVAMVDRNDFGSGTSQSSSNMVWGGSSTSSTTRSGSCSDLPLAEQARRRLSSRIAETRFLAALDRSSRHHPWFGALGAIAYWGLGSFHTQAPRHRSRKAIAALEPAIDISDVRGGLSTRTTCCWRTTHASSASSPSTPPNMARPSPTTSA